MEGRYSSSSLLGLLPPPLLLLFSQLLVTATLLPAAAVAAVPFHHQGLAGVQPLSRIAIHRVSLSLDSAAYVKASPLLLGRQGEDTEWVTVEIGCPKPSADDWIGVFSPANFNSSSCLSENGNTKEQAPHICSAPIKVGHLKEGYMLELGIDTREWPIITATPCPQQGSGDDCAIFVCKYMEYLSQKNIIGLPFSQADMDLFRGKLAVAIVQEVNEMRAQELLCRQTDE